MSDSEKSMDASKKRFSNVVWAILVILGLAWWFYPQIRILVKPESLSAVSQETAEEMQRQQMWIVLMHLKRWKRKRCLWLHR